MKTGNQTADMAIAASMQAQSDRITELEAALIAIASAPYPLHDHCTEEQWEMACNLYQAALEDDA